MKTNAMRVLEGAGLPYRAASYDVDEDDLSAGAVAEKIGMPLERVFKTLAGRGDDGEVRFFVIPGDAELDLKKAAKASGAKAVALLPLKELLPVTGYVRGGCSPIGAKKPFPVYIEEGAQLYEEISVSAGVRGTQMILSPAALAIAANATFADLV